MYTSRKRGLVTIEDFANVKQKYITEDIGKLHLANTYLFIKRCLDIILSLLAGILLVIPMIFITILIRIDSPGKAIFSQTRLGKDEKPFTIYKFRSMYLDAEKNGAQWAEECDSRVTKVGKVLRNTRLDELPQLFNILKGDMSIVGPRPERPEFYEVFDTYIVGFRQRMKVKPGLTGHAQVIGGYSFLPEEKIVLDLEYIKKCSLKFDLLIVVKTIGVVFKGDRNRESIGEIKKCSMQYDLKKN